MKIGLFCAKIFKYKYSLLNISCLFDVVHPYFFLFKNKNKAFYFFNTLSIHFWKKAPPMQNITKVKLFRSPNILIISIYLNLCTKIRLFCIFGTLSMTKIAIYYLGICSKEHWKQAQQILSITKAKLLRRPNILIISMYLHFRNKIRQFWIIGTPCMAKIAFY